MSVTLQDMFKENSITTDTIEFNDTLMRKIKKSAGGIPDYRHQPYIRHPLIDIVMTVFFEVMGNANGWGEIESFAKRIKNVCVNTWNCPMGFQRMMHAVS